MIKVIIFLDFFRFISRLSGLLNLMDLLQTSVTLKQVAEKLSRINGMFMNKKEVYGFYK